MTKMNENDQIMMFVHGLNANGAMGRIFSNMKRCHADDVMVIMVLMILIVMIVEMLMMMIRI